MSHNKTEDFHLREVKLAESHHAYVRAMLDSDSEQNRQLLTLSSLVIGLLMGIFETDDLKHFASFILWIISCCSFAACVIVTLIFFPKNAEYLKLVIDGSSKSEQLSKHLRIISITASLTFVLGIVSLFSLVLYESKFILQKELHTLSRTPAITSTMDIK